MDRPENQGEFIGAARISRDDSVPLLLTKLHRPVLGPGLERRVRLLERLNGSVDRSLTLISAPAGYGKTTLASMWLQDRPSPTAWVSVDEHDDDLLTFTGYVVAAAQRALPGVELETQTLLHAPLPPSVATIARYLLNDLQRIPQRLTLALDDVHLIRDERIFELLTELVRRPLSSLQLVLICRRDPPLPLATLRARGELEEVRARDLQFTSAETAAFLGRMLKRDIPAAVATAWAQHTEGWVTALRLTALALLQRSNAPLPQLDAPGTSLYAQEYLRSDVLAQLPAQTQRWLLNVSVLDRFCAPLCEAVGAPEVSAADGGLTGRSFIRGLQNDNMFLVSLDDDGVWFRFHYLFRTVLSELLAERSAPEAIAEIQRRAGAWCAERGLLDEALRYMLGAGDCEAAADFVEQHRYALMNAAEWARLERWLKVLPAKVVEQRPLLINALGLLAVHRGENLECITALQQAEKALAALPIDSAETRIARAEMDALSYVGNYSAGQFGQAAENARRSLRALPPDALHVRSLAISIEAFALHMGGAPKQSVDTLNRALSDPAWPAPIRTRFLPNLCTARYMNGELPLVLPPAHEATRAGAQFARPDVAAWGMYYLGVVHYARGEFADAEPYLLSLLERRHVSSPLPVAFGGFALALIRQTQGRRDEAEKIIEALGGYLEGMEHKLAGELINAFRVEMGLREGRAGEASHLAHMRSFDRLPRWYFYAPRFISVKLLLAEGTPVSLAQAGAQIREIRDEATRLCVRHAQIDALALESVVDAALGDESAALRCLAEALALAEPGGFVRNFADLGVPMARLLGRLQARPGGLSASLLAYVGCLLSAFPGRAPAPRSNGAKSLAPDALALIDPLTEREAHVLGFLATDLSPSEIAVHLALSPTTVRTHIRNIYGKLDAHSRCEAVLRAKELGLL